MMKAPKGMAITTTVEEHLRFGSAIKEFDLALRQMATGCDSGLGMWRFPKTSPKSRAIRRVMDALQTLRNVMDNEICGALDYHDRYGKDATRFYYGDRDPQP
jgi:hypothetical protein